MGRFVYGAVVRPSEDGGYWAEVPDLPGCFAQGDDYMDTMRSLSDGIETHLSAMFEYGTPVPESHPVETDDGDVVYVLVNSDGFKLGVPTISAAEAARRLGVSKSCVSQLIGAGGLVAERSAEGTQVTLESVEALAATSRPAVLKQRQSDRQ